MKYEGDDQHCEFFVYTTPGYTFAMTHNSMIYSFEDYCYSIGDDGSYSDIWICEELEELDFDEIDCWVD